MASTSIGILDVSPGWSLHSGQTYGTRLFVEALWVVCTFASNKRGLNKVLVLGRWSLKVTGWLTECLGGVVMGFLAEGT